LKTAVKSRTEDDRKWLRTQFVDLLKKGVLQYKNLPLSKHLKLYMFIRKEKRNPLVPSGVHLCF
jgi:hypothetical protein